MKVSEPVNRHLVGWALACVAALIGLGALGLAARGFSDPAVQVADVVAVGIIWLVAAAIAALVPWPRLPRAAPTILVLVGLVILAVGDRVSHLSAEPAAVAYYATAVVLLLAWVGLSQRRGTALVGGLLAAVALVVVVNTDGSILSVAVVAIAVPVAVALGETLAWQNARLGRGRLVDDQRVDDLQALATSVSILRDHRTTLEHAASMLGQLANDIFHGDYVSTVLRGGNGRLVPFSVGDDPGQPSTQTAALVETAVARAEVQLVAENGSALLVIPLVGPTEIGGAVVVRRPRETDDPFTLHLARLFASQAGSALEQIQVIENLSEDLRRDQLTGIGNRRHAEALVDSLTPGDAVVLIDLDFFKQVNDTQGHAAGDELLQQLSNHLRDSVRDSDLVARLGGDEFVLVARDAEADAQLTANRLLVQWQDLRPDSTFSAGVAVHIRDDLPAQTLEFADKALYEAKERGRNQVRLYGADPVDRFQKTATTD
jgi:diguanylate cyclase (GGDEF)-like protein